ncbi:MAG: homocysteine S-methyltransferase family protein [Myxococcota bacterium]|nr:homocysteine S-methyltransferase family protein [Myxococcota bacterium]
MNGVTVLDGPMGTELARRGVPTPLHLWSASAIDGCPEQISRIHADYASAGATVHTANTFRTDPWTLRKFGQEGRWEELTGRAVEIARQAVPEGHRVAGSLSPLEDCYRPDRTPDLQLCRKEHSRFARGLVEAGVDLILCETFPHPGEALAALDAALEHDLPVWLSLTQGPNGELMEEGVLVETLAEAARRGAEAVLVNCSPLATIQSALERLAPLELTFGAYGNVGMPCPEQGWINPGDADAASYSEAVRSWLATGATLVGGCCGTSTEHIAAISALVQGSP